MRKILVGVIVVIVCAGLAPFGMGILTQQQLQKLAAHVSTTSNTSVSIKSYQRGWFSSTATLHLQIQAPQRSKLAKYLPSQTMKNGVNTVEFDLVEKIKHGPVIFTREGLKLGRGYIESSFNLDPNMQQSLQAIFADQASQPQFTNQTFITLGGSIVNTLEIPAYEYKKPGKGTIAWKGLNGKWILGSKLQDTSADVKFAGVEVKGADYQLLIKAITLKASQTGDFLSSWKGMSAFKIPQIQFSDKQQDLFNLQDLRFHLTSQIANEKLSTAIQSSLGKIQVNSNTYGPGNLETSFHDLNAKALQQIATELRANNKGQLSTKQRQMLVLSLLPKVPDLFSKGFNYQLKRLDLVLPEGKFQASGQAKVPQQKKTSAPNVLALINKIQANFALKIPVKLAEKTLVAVNMKKLYRQQLMMAFAAKKQQRLQQNSGASAATTSKTFKPMTTAEMNAKATALSKKQIAVWLNSGMLIQQGDVFAITIQYQQGQLTLNGKAIGVNKKSPKIS